MGDPFARASPSLESEEMNSLLQNLLQSSFAHQPFSANPPPQAAAPAIGADDASIGFNYSDPGSRFMADARVFDIDEFDSDCKGADVSEGPSDPAPRRSAKRTRAADVHNISEKRRRSRINERMKALQKLIPNSNKTDKASMLDEAIEYLKQLQLQVQMLSMKNGVSLFPYSSPIPQPGIASLEHELLTANQQNLLFPIQDITDNKASFGLETSTRPHFQTLNHLASSKDICQVSQLHLDMQCSGKNSSSGVSS